MRVATIDIGTNTALLLVAERSADGSLVPVLERATITRLGEGVDRTRTLAPAALARTRVCLEEYAALVAQSGADRVAVVGTSAMRDASGGGELVAHVRGLFGVELRVLSGSEEARLTFHGALSGIRAPSSDTADPYAVFDIGGGSTEVVIARATDSTPTFAQSYDVGSVRLTERIIRSDPPSGTELAQIRDLTTRAFASVPDLPPGAQAVGVAGTVTTLAAVAMGLTIYDAGRVHGSSLATARVRSVVTELEAMDVETRRAVPGMEPKRADVIVAGGYIVLALAERWNADSFLVSDRGVRWGLAQELADELPR